jgi:mersacidin/lichenicidin family type 2 lantibiotic
MNRVQSNLDVIRAWKDPRYRDSLSEADQLLLPPNPAGTVELSDKELSAINGGVTWTITTSSEPCGVVVFTAVTFTIEVLAARMAKHSRLGAARSVSIIAHSVSPRCPSQAFAMCVGSTLLHLASESIRLVSAVRSTPQTSKLGQVWATLYATRP